MITLSRIPATDPISDSALVISGNISDDREVSRAAYLIIDSAVYMGSGGASQGSQRTSIQIAPGKEVSFSFVVPLLVGPNEVEIVAVDNDNNVARVRVSVTRRSRSRPQAVAVGVVHSCALLENGEVYCWGINEAGQLGVGKPGYSPDPFYWSYRPLAVTGGIRFTSLDAGPGSGGQGVGFFTGHTCGLTADGTAYCWGYNQYGETGTGTQGPSYSARSTPAPSPVLGGLKFLSVDAGGHQTCGIATSGQAYCWGSNIRGELGRNVPAEGCVARGKAYCTPIPLPVETSQLFHSVSAGLYHTCALAPQGQAYCWGIHVRGELGHTGSRGTHLPSEPVQGGLTFARLTSGGGHTPQSFIDRGHSCGVTVHGDAYCWGANDSGQLGIGGSDATFHNVPLHVAAEAKFTDLSAGRAHTCGITEAGEALCWGRNAEGQLGDGSTTERPGPVRVAGGHQFAHLSAGWSHSCGVTVERAIYCWGANSGGQLGTGGTTHSTRPVRVMGF